MPTEKLYKTKCVDCGKTLKNSRLTYIIENTFACVNRDSEVIVELLSHHTEYEKNQGHSEAEIFRKDGVKIGNIEVHRSRYTELGTVSGNFKGFKIVWLNPISRSIDEHD